MNVERIKDIDIKEKNVYEKNDKNKSNGVEKSICFYEDFIKLKEKILLKEKEIVEKRNKCLNKNEDNCSLVNKNKVIYRTFDEFYKYKKSYEEYENKRQKEALQLLNKRNINNNKQIIESISNNEKYSYIKFKKERQGTVKYLKEYFQKIQEDNLKKKKKNYLLNKLERKAYMTKELVDRKKEKDKNVIDENITNDDITNDDITNDDITNDDVTNDDITNDDITNDDITNDNITSDNITSDNITSDNITSDNITNDNITSDTITCDNSKNIHFDNMNEQDIKLIQELIDAMKKDYKNDEDYISNLFEDLYNNNQTYMIDKIFHILKNVDKKVLLESTINTFTSDDSHLHLNNNDMLINEDFLQTNKEKNSMEIIDIINNLDNCKDQNYNIQKINDNNKKEKNQEQEILDNMHEHMHDNKCNNGLEYNNNVNCNSDLHEVLWVKQNDNNNNNKKDDDNNNDKDDDDNNNNNNNNDKDDDDDDNNNYYYNECIHTSTQKKHIHINNQINNKLYIEDDNSENNKNEDYEDKDINIIKEKNNKLIKKIKQKSKKNIKDTNYTNKFDWFYNTINDIYEEEIVNNHQDDINYSLYDENKDTFSDEDSEKNDMFLWLKNKDIENVLSEKRTSMDDNY
ncbi:conserved Plasmodium protein, unknown function [Plasmodium sp. gorilla clade G2]|uniref:conserved Plasmodium protein, unknown function n=1 Tax=Plasmodium sp. gorilla clade G2 TaxID=880535 RepID=UPI000D209CE7|nr:conserved Plasmodium protein, unknown function [Plasmodium sp. gorilla clade G2]SOV17900.1 conserved Plasmodium protein, unknown function [Plasmodium sp. gorilla clade G2]